MDPITLALIGAGLGLGQTIISSIGMGKAKKEAEAAIGAIPTQTIDPEIQKLLKLRQARLGSGLSATARQLSTQGIESAATSATKAAQAMGKGAGLSTIGAIQKEKERGYLKLGADEESAKERGIAGYTQAVGMMSTARARQIASEAEKQALKANIALERLGAKRAGMAQGIQGMFGSFAAGASNKG